MYYSSRYLFFNVLADFEIQKIGVKGEVLIKAIESNMFICMDKDTPKQKFGLRVTFSYDYFPLMIDFLKLIIA